MSTAGRDQVTRVLDCGAVVAVVRSSRHQGSFMDVVSAASRGGIRCVEITMDSSDALQAIKDATRQFTELRIGAGTVLDAQETRSAVTAGACFIVTPVVRVDVVEAAHDMGVAVIMGAMTPTEALTAWESGADMVKVFPASVVGPAFVREMRGPFPEIPLVPTGGITADNAGEFIRAGAVAVCAGSWLVDKQAVAEGRFGLITEKARHLVEAVRKAREEVA